MPSRIPASAACPFVLALAVACSPAAEKPSSSAGDASYAERPAAGSHAVAKTCRLPTKFAWTSSGALVGPKPDAAHPIISVKDPTIAFFGDRFHVYATTGSADGSWNMVYLNFRAFDQAAVAPEYFMDRTPGFSGYHCAPELFYFRPQNKWYLVMQSGLPQFATSDDPSDPASWSRPRNFFDALPPGFPRTALDFFVICDDDACYLFFGGDDGHVYRSKTRKASFPNGFGSADIVLSDSTDRVYEGDMVYKISGQNQYLLLVEAVGTGGRYYRSFTADSLDSPTWRPLADTEAEPFAGARNVRYAPGVADWTDDVSHGELVRDGYDEALSIDACQLRFLYQGRDPSKNPEYSQLPYRLGLLTQR